MNGTCGALLALLLLLAGCAASTQLFSHNPIPLDTLDGNYRKIASCSFDRLARRLSGLAKDDLPEQGMVRIAWTTPSERWELTFVNQDAGRQTRLDWTAGAYPSEHVLSTVRACAA
jgi:hypothetical protein